MKGHFMKDITRLLKKFSSVVYGEKGYVEHKTRVIRQKWSVLKIPTKQKNLVAVRKIASRTIEIFEEFAIHPSYTIPHDFLEDSYITFTKCRECGNLAIYSDNPNAEIKMVQCIEKPPYHRYILE